MSELPDNYASLHTGYCAGINEILKGSGYSVTCTRKEYGKLHEQDGKITFVWANIEFERSGQCSAKAPDRDMTISFDHPTELRNGSALAPEDIKGYEFRAVLFNGEESEHVEVLIK